VTVSLASSVQVRKTAITVETIHHEGGPVADRPVRIAAALAVVRNPFAGRYEPDLLGFQTDLRTLGTQLATDLLEALGDEPVEAYGKAAIVGVAGELEHGALWHEAGGWAMRSVLEGVLERPPAAIVPSAKVVASAGYRLVVPVHHVHAAYVRSHFSGIEIGVQDAPRPDEIVYALAMATGGRIHARAGGLRADQITGIDGNR
jgi:amino acid synthesis protein